MRFFAACSKSSPAIVDCGHVATVSHYAPFQISPNSAVSYISRREKVVCVCKDGENQTRVIMCFASFERFDLDPAAARRPFASA